MSDSLKDLKNILKTNEDRSDAELVELILDTSQNRQVRMDALFAIEERFFWKGFDSCKLN